MHCREKAGIVGNDGHFGVVTTCLGKPPFPELHEYIRILFEPGVESPVVVL